MKDIHYIPQGNANFYTLFKGDKWLAQVQMNGELSTVKQEDIMESICDKLRENDDE